jgi:toxin CptA
LLAAFVAAAHTAAGAIAVTLPLPWPWRLALAILVLLSGAWSAATHLWPRAPWAVREARWGEDGWELTLGTGQHRLVQLVETTFVGTRLVVLNFRGPSWRRYSLVLLPDGLDPQTRRRLRVRLRLAAVGAGA